MTFRDWLEVQFESGRIDKAELEKEVDKLRQKVEKEIEIDNRFSKAINEEFWNIL